MSISTIHLTADQIASIASVAVAASRDDITPVITAVRLSAEDGRVEAVATDRYRIARVQFALATEEEEHPQSDIDGVSIPAKLLTDFVKSVRALKLRTVGLTVTLAYDAGNPDALGMDKGALITLTYSGMVTMSAAPVYGNYPPVKRLIPAEDGLGEASMLALRMDWLADAAKLSLPGDSRAKNETAVYRAQFVRTDNPNKPGPVLFTRKAGREDLAPFAQYMVQPNLILN